MLDYKNMSFEDIMDWCEANKQDDWLDAKLSETVKVEVYPYITYTDEYGRKRRKQDKSAKPEIIERPISYLMIKEAFVAKFMPDIKPKAKKHLSMRERFNARRNKKK